MHCQPWMNETPVKRKTPLQVAKQDMEHWASRVKELRTQLDSAQTDLADAMDRFQREASKIVTPG